MTVELVPYLIEQGTAWVVAQQARYRPFGRALSKEEWTSLAPFFTANTLESVIVSEAGN